MDQLFHYLRVVVATSILILISILLWVYVPRVIHWAKFKSKHVVKLEADIIVKAVRVYPSEAICIAELEDYQRFSFKEPKHNIVCEGDLLHVAKYVNMKTGATRYCYDNTEIYCRYEEVTH